MAYTLTVHISPEGTLRHQNGERSKYGHMFYTLHDGSSSTLKSYGFAPDGEKGILDGASKIGRSYIDDYDNYDRNATKSYTIEITKEQYEKLKDYGNHPGKYGFKRDYSAPFNSCVDFVFKAIEVGGLKECSMSLPLVNKCVISRNSEGKLLPEQNEGKILSVFNPSLPDARMHKNASPDAVPGSYVPAIQSRRADYISKDFFQGSAVTIADAFSAASKTFSMQMNPVAGQKLAENHLKQETEVAAVKLELAQETKPDAEAKVENGIATPKDDFDLA